jgi:general secretion pathway protein G
VLLDPWQHPYVYIEPTPEHPKPRVLSLGADGKPGGEGECADIDSDEVSEKAR